MDENSEKLPLLFKCFRDSLIGKNTRGIIHNINSPLQVLSMQIELLRMDYLKLKDRLSSPDNFHSGDQAHQELVQLMERGYGRLSQVEEVLQRINTLIAVIAARVSETDETGGTPVMLNQLLEEQIEFWKSDLFFKHKVFLSLKLPPISPVIVTREDILRDVIDGILFGCLEQIRDFSEPRIEIECVPAQKESKGHLITFSQNGPLFPVEDVRGLIDRFTEKGGEDFPVFENTSQGYFSLLLAFICAEIIGSRVEIGKDHIDLSI